MTIGASLRRREDGRLLRGRGRFVDDIKLSGQLHAALLRSPHAHARIMRVDCSAAAEMPGVEVIITGEDVRALGPVRGHLWTTIPAAIERWLRPTLRLDTQYLLPFDRVRHVGEPLAAVVARDRYLAEDALERIEVEYEALEAVATPERALDQRAPRLNADWPDNVSFQVAGTVGQPEGAFAEAPHHERVSVRMQRHTGTPVENRAVLAAFEPQTGEMAVWCNTQIPHVVREVIAEMLGLAEHRVRVIAVDVGGGFGVKAIVYPEDVLVPLLALRAGRPVKWTEDRQEHLIASLHSRDQAHDIEVFADAEGRLRGVRDRFVIDTGAYNPLRLTPTTNSIAHLLGPYRVPNVDVAARVVVTNKTVNAPYRGAGRPEAVWAMERALDRLARKMGVDPVELRLRNTLTTAEMPYDTGMFYRDGQPLVYDSGDHLTCLKRALEAVGWPAFRAEQAAAWREGRYLGLGVAGYIEGTGIGPFEGATVRVDSSGKVVVYTGACAQGQGHETIFAQICAERLGVRFEDVTVVGGDTAGIPYGWGTLASRSTVVAGSAVADAATAVREKALRTAAELLEVSTSDLELRDSEIRVAGAPDRRLSLRQVAEALAPQMAMPAGREPGLEAQSYFRPETVTYANGLHAAKVEVDAETGEVAVLRYVVVHDCGRVINPLLADAQIRGGVAQGVGGALYEEVVYGEGGECLTASFMDYLVPTAMEVPEIQVEHQESPSPRNPLGVKGLGEGGAIPGPAAIANAVEDALQPFGVVINEVPLSPGRVRDLLRKASERR
jgi:carbon-monoxide dehydrogenase large subunit